MEHRILRQFSMLAAPAVFLWLIAPAAAMGASDSLDPNFGSGGIATTPIGPTGTVDVGLAMARAPNGQFVVAGNSGSGTSFGSGGAFALVRYNADGGLDSGFGGGKVTTDFVADPNEADEAHAVAIQPDGKVVAVGIAGEGAANGFDNFALARYNANGTPDTGFGAAGKVTTDLQTSSFDDAWAVALQPDGKIVVAGMSNYDFALARYNSNGTLDSSFGTGGVVTTVVAPYSNASEAHAVAVESNGKIVAAGFADMHAPGDYTDHDFALVRYQSNGTLDASFGSGGIVTTAVSSEPIFKGDEANAVVLQPDGKIVLAGSSDVQFPGDGAGSIFALARYNVNGTLDTGFGTGGKVTTQMSPLSSVVYGLALEADGKLVAGGRAADCAGECHSDFAVARYNGNGSLDTSFDADGKSTAAVAPYSQTSIARGVAIQPSDNKIVLAGYADMGPPEYLDYDFAVIRYRPNGDTTPPAAPSLTGTDPASPANDNSPAVRGTAEAGSRVRIYANAACTGDVAGSDSAGGDGSFSVPVTVADNTTTTFHATATDPAGNTSPCSSTSVTYVEQSTGQTLPPIYGGGGSFGLPETGGATETGGEPQAGARPTIKAPAGSAGTSTVDRRGYFTVPRTTVVCPPGGGSCRVSTAIWTAKRVSVRGVTKAPRRIRLGTKSFTVNPGKRAAVKVRLSKTGQTVMRRLKKVKVVAQIAARNDNGRRAKSVPFTLRKP